MNKKLGRLVDPTMGLYFVVLLVFAAASFLLNQPMLAAAEVGGAGCIFPVGHGYLGDCFQRGDPPTHGPDSPGGRGNCLV